MAATLSDATLLGRRRRHVLLLEKLRAEETLSGREQKELERYEGDARKAGPVAGDLDEAARQRKRIRIKRALERDIAIDFSKQKMRRRNYAGKKPLYFLQQYFPHIFYLPFCPNQKHNINELEDKIRFGGMKAIADMRGGGKTSIAKGMIVWGLVYGLIKWVPWIECNFDNAKDSVEDIKLMFDNAHGKDLFGADFPEYCTPIRALNGEAQKARGQTFGGERTKMKVQAHRIILPTIDPDLTPNGTGASGGIIQAFGADKPIRGLVREGIRPDMVAINDIETEETAKSPTMTENIRRNITNAVLGLAGPAQKLGIVILCTIIRQGCVADQLTDRSKNPQWQGERMQMMPKQPDDMQRWARYMDKRQREQRAGSADCREADAYYKRNRKAMDDGARVANKLRYVTTAGKDGKPSEISAVQHVFNIIADRGMEYFLCECQNDPPEEITAINEMQPHIVADKINGMDRGVIPDWAERVTMMVDVHDAKLYWAVVAWRQGFVGFVVEYGVDPVFSPIAGSVTKKEKERQTELAIIEALKVLRKKSKWQMDGKDRGVDLALIDAGYKDAAVYTFAKSTGGGVWRPAKGGSGRTGSYHVPKKSKTIKMIGSGWHHSYLAEKRQWLIIHDANKWKRRVQDGFSVGEVEDDGSISLWGGDPVEHRAFSEQIVAEAYNTEKMRMEVVKGFTNNHWLDCMAGCCLAAEILGVTLLQRRAENVVQDGTKRVAQQGNRKIRRRY